MSISRELPTVLPQAVKRTNPDGTATKYLIDWESLTRDLASTAFEETEERVSTAEDNINDLDTFTVSLQSQVNENAANLVIEATTRATADAAEASLRIALDAATTSSFAAVNTTLTAQAGINSSVASSITTLNAQVGTNTASISSISVAYAAADTALAASISSLATTVGGHTATLATYGASINGVEVKFGVQGYINGSTGGFVFTGVLKNDGSVAYDMEITSNVTINGNLVVNGTITTSAIATNAVTQVGTATAYGGTTICTVGLTTGASTLVAICSVSEVSATTYTKAFSGGIITRAFNVLLDSSTFAYVESNDTVVDAQYLGGSSYTFTGAMTPATVSYSFPVSAGYHEVSLFNPFAAAVRLSVVLIEMKR